MVARTLPNYKVVPLRSDEIRIAVIQSRLRGIDSQNPAPGKKANIDHMFRLMDLVQSRSPKDLVVFGELPISGLSRRWDKVDVMKVATEIPGPETERIGEKAREYNCYIKFGCAALLPDWPGHVVNIGIIIDPSGTIIYKRWFARNLVGSGFGTTVYDVLDEYIEKYGKEEIWPVARTDIGNIAYMPEVLEPEIPRAMAIRGTEIGIRSITGGSGSIDLGRFAWRGHSGVRTFLVDFQANCMASNIFGVFNNNAASEEDGVVWEQGTGFSTVFDCNGHLMAEATSHHETVIEAILPMAAYRTRHSIPNYPKALYTSLYDEYEPKFPPNSFKDYLPKNLKDGAEHYRRIARW